MKTTVDTQKAIRLITLNAIEKLNDGIGLDVMGCDLHNELFNTDYFIIGYYEAEKWLTKNYGIFAAIEKIKDYEVGNFGELTTDISSSEKVVNVLAYIIGEEVLNESETLCNNWDNHLTEANLKAIVKELKANI